METIFVTGGAGFIGGAFVRQVLAETAARVVNLDKLTYAGNLDSLAHVARDTRHVFVEGDIGDGKLLARLLKEHQPQRIVNFAAESHVDRSIDGPRQFVETNVLGTFELLSAAKSYWDSLARERRERFRFLHVSTDEVYGSLGPTGKFSETTAYAPNSPYSASKAASDHFVRSFHHTFGLPVLTTNCSNNYGPYQFPEKLIPLMVLNALEGKPLPVYGDGQNVRDWLFVEDHCRAIRTVLERGRVGEVYNIGGNSERTNLQIVRTICATVDRLRPELAHRPCESLIRFVPDRPGHDRRYAIDAGKIERELGWQPAVSFEEGIERTVRWYLENPEWVERVQSGGYRRERLGLAGGAAPSSAAPSSAVPSRAARSSSACASTKHEAVRTAVVGGNGHSSAAAVAAVEYVEGPIHDLAFRPLKRYCDARGWLTELYREDELDAAFHPVMAYVSQTQPGVARGPHEHVDQADYFAFIGPGDFKLYLWDARPDSPTFGNKLARVVGESDAQAVTIPPGVVHAYKNVSAAPGWVFNAPNRLYAGWGKKEPVDEIRHEECEGSPFAI